MLRWHTSCAGHRPSLNTVLLKAHGVEAGSNSGPAEHAVSMMYVVFARVLPVVAISSAVADNPSKTKRGFTTFLRLFAQASQSVPLVRSVVVNRDLWLS